MSLYIERHGHADNPALVMVHGWGMHSGIWQSWLEALTPYFCITLVDLPGFGRSAALKTGSMSELAKQILAAAPPKAHWLGWSLGGQIAAEAAVLAPERVISLTTIAANPCFVAQEDWAYGMPADTFNGFVEALSTSPVKTLNRFAMLQTQGGDQAREILKLLKTQLAEVPAPALENLQAGLELLAQNHRARWHQIGVPHLQLLGAQDQLVPVALADQQAGLVKVYQTAAHLPFISHQQQLTEDLLMFTGASA